jgi:hypothetical protein
MSKLRFSLNLLATAAFLLMVTSMANAQATRTWVSGVGDDVNPCSRTAPCKTFAGAISKTAPGGEIDALDPAGYGTLTITKAITVDGGTGSGWASSLSSSTTAFIINANASTDTIHLRNISMNGAGTTLGLNGVRIIGANTVHIENCRIFRFSGDGIHFENSTVSRLIVRNTHISECGGDGVEVAGTSASANAITMENSSITRCGNGFRITNRGVAAISNSEISLNNATGSSAAILTDTAVAGGAIIDLENCQVNANAIGVQANTNQAVRLSNTHMTANGNALNFTGGTIASYGNNRIFGNAGGENFAALTAVQQR